MSARINYLSLVVVILVLSCGREPPSNPRVIRLSPPAAMPTRLARTSFNDALIKAASRWSYPAISCTSLQVVLSSPSGKHVVSEDGVNDIVFRTQTWCHNDRCGNTSTFPLRAAAMTTTYPAWSQPGRVREADVELNAVHFDWVAGSSRPTAPLDAVLTHEIGHVLGFSDVCVDEACPGAEAISVMRSGRTDAALSPWDIERLCAAYPK